MKVTVIKDVLTAMYAPVPLIMGTDLSTYKSHKLLRTAGYEEVNWGAIHGVSSYFSTSACRAVSIRPHA